MQRLLGVLESFDAWNHQGLWKGSEVFRCSSRIIKLKDVITICGRNVRCKGYDCRRFGWSLKSRHETKKWNIPEWSIFSNDLSRKRSQMFNERFLSGMIHFPWYFRLSWFSKWRGAKWSWSLSFGQFFVVRGFFSFSNLTRCLERSSRLGKSSTTFPYR